MKNFKRVLSLALAAMMVIGGLAFAPVDAKADVTYTQVKDVSEITADGSYVIVEPTKQVVMTTDGLVSDYTTYYLSTDSVTLGDANELAYAGEKGIQWKIEGTVAAGKITDAKISANGTYLTWNDSAGNKFAKTTTPTAADTWTITETETDGIFKIAFTNTIEREIGYNASSPRFAPYKGTQLHNLLIYKVSGTADGGNEGGAEEPKDIDLPETATPEEIVNAAYKACADGVKLNGKWTLTGVVKEISDAYEGGTDYKNVAITIQVGDMTDKLMGAYRVVNGTDVSLDDLQNLRVGDTVTLNGTIGYYKTNVQFVQGSTIEKIEKAPVVIPDIELPATATPEEIVNAAYKACEDGVKLKGTWKLTGVIKEIKDAYEGGEDYKNVELIIQVGDMTDKLMGCYRVVNGTDVTLDDLQGLAVGDTVTVEGTIGYYKTNVQFVQGSTIEKIEKAVVEPPVVPETGDFASITYIVVLMGAALVAAGFVAKKRAF